MSKTVFIDLPFIPEENQVIFVDRTGNRRVNNYIRKHYGELCTLFRKKNLIFCYLPILFRDVVDYHFPHLSSERKSAYVESANSLTSLFADSVTDMRRPVLLVPLCNEDETDKRTKLQAVEIVGGWWPLGRTFSKLAEKLSAIVRAENKKRREMEYMARFSVKVGEGNREMDVDGMFSFARKRGQDVRYSLVAPKPECPADDGFNTESLLIIAEIKERIAMLRNMGVNTSLLHQIVDENVPLSRLVITSDFRILLPDYHQEIKMSSLPKAVYLLFLRHPEGILFKELADYYDELLEIYLSLNPIGSREKHEKSIADITNPLLNSINEKCARIREAFVGNFDDSIAKNYYITGARATPKRIALDTDLVTWE